MTPILAGLSVAGFGWARSYGIVMTITPGLSLVLAIVFVGYSNHWPSTQVRWYIGLWAFWFSEDVISYGNHCEQYIPSMVSILQCVLFNFPLYLISNGNSSAALHFHSPENKKRMKLFWTAFAGIFLWQIIPSYIFPLLNGLSVFCLASQHLPPHIQDIFTNFFGGVDSDEGLGLLSICLNWQYITS